MIRKKNEKMKNLGLLVDHRVIHLLKRMLLVMEQVLLEVLGFHPLVEKLPVRNEDLFVKLL